MSSPGEAIDLRTSAAEAVTNQLRRELLDGTISPGSRIMPKDQADRFGLSVVPVREALRRLEAEDLVVTSPQRATYAADIGLEDLAGVYELRRILEAELAGRAAELSGEGDHRRCREALKWLGDSEPYSPEFFEAHRAFHWQLLAPAGTEVARRVLERLWQSVDRYVALAARRLPEFSSPDRLESFHSEHQMLATVFEAGDRSVARRALSAHLTTTELMLKQAYDVLASDPPAGPTLPSLEQIGHHAS